jgi:riboflavin kinase/FMN adenylyltransferase
MQIWNGSASLPNTGASFVLTIGNFDGVHRGHVALIEATRALAARKGCKSLALTFWPHPMQVLRPDTAPRLLQTLNARLETLKAVGIDQVVVEPFTADFATLSPEEFVDRILVNTLGAQGVVVGENFTFGHKAKGKVRDLADFLAQRGIELKTIGPVYHEGQVCSSTLLRKCIEMGDVGQASKILGRPWPQPI